MSVSLTPTTWNLADLFPAHDSPEMQSAWAALEAAVADFEQVRAQLDPGMDAAAFMDIVARSDASTRQAYRIYGFATLAFAANTQDQAAQSFMARVQQFMAQMENRTLFFSLWWKDLDEANAARLMDASGDYRYWLEEMRHFKPHTLSEAEEKIVNIKNVTGMSALVQLYDTITNRYTFKITVDGEEKELTRDSLMVYARHHDPALRAAAYQELYKVYGNDAPILGQMFQTMVNDWRAEQVELRRYATPISTRNLSNDLPDAVVATLLDVAERNAEVFQRYFRLKARYLGVERLRRYDIYAPLNPSDKSFDYDRAAQMVFEAFGKFHPQVEALARRIFDENHIDSQVRKGKRGGAFCQSLYPGLTPYVLVNYQGRVDDVATLAHELGHAIHAQLAFDHTTYTFHSSLPLAETASTFGEMLLIDRLLEDENDESVRRDILFKQVDDAYATIQRQAFFAMFERTAHEMVHAGATVDQLAEAYVENLKKQFGDAVELNDEFKWEWVSIPHFIHVPFYVYAYSFGQLLVLSLYQQYRREGEAFKPRYLKILSAGGSQAPAQVLAEAGIDITDPKFWQGGYDVISAQLDMLEALPAPV
jgi:oligoendopeptidase F